MKDFQHLYGNCVVPSIALTCLSQIIEGDLAQMLYKELFPLFTCSQPVIRKKVCALCYKIYIHSSENEHIIEEMVPYLSDRLKDSDLSVKMTAISTIYEISKIDPAMFVVTIPVVYQLLCEVNNNWVLIKIIKLLTEFCNVEPRLKMKLRPKFQDLLES